MKSFFLCLALTAVLACTPESKPGVPISFSANEISLDSEGTDRTITVVSTGGTWYVSPSASWLSVSPESGSGEIRPVSQAERRATEAARLGFKRIYVSSYTHFDRKPQDIEVVKLSDIPALVRNLFK